MLNFKPTFSLSSFTFIKRVFSTFFHKSNARILGLLLLNVFSSILLFWCCCKTQLFLNIMFGFSLLIYTVDFCVSFLYTAILLNLFTLIVCVCVCVCVCVFFRIFYVQKLCHLQIEIHLLLTFWVLFLIYLESPV